MRTSTFVIVGLWVLCMAWGCNKGTATPGPATAENVPFIAANAAPGMSGCNHDGKSGAIAKHSWPYPADSRNVQWGNEYKKMKLKLSPNPATFYTATVTWKKGAFIEVLDSEMYIKKPRKVIANEDVWVTRKVWDQGLKLDKRFKAAAKGETVDFLFYNSRGSCLIETPEAPAWTPCTLGETFEGVTADEPFACEQVWWMKVEKTKIDKGWMPFEQQLMVRLPPPGGAAK